MIFPTISIKLLKTALLSFLLITCCSPPTTYAVIVGIADYKVVEAGDGDLRYAAKDALKFMEFLKSKQGGSVPASQIRTLTNIQATKQEILSAFEIFKTARPGDKVYFFFSGHGDQGVFMPYDVTVSGNNLLRHDEVKAAFKKSKAGTKICIADACMSGSMKRLNKGSVAKNRNYSGFKTIGKANNVVVILSSRASQKSQENGRLQEGTFTYYLLKALYGAADRNKDKAITIRETFLYISPRIKKTSGNGQAPVIYGKFSDNLILSTI